MQNLTLTQAQNIVNTVTNKAASNTSNVNVTALINMLTSVNATTFASVTQASKVKTAAAHKTQNIYKITMQNITLCNSAASLYSNAVNKQISNNKATSASLQAFTALASNYTSINNSYSVVALTSNLNKHYLRAIVNKCNASVYYCVNTNTFIAKHVLAQYLTASAARTLLSTNTSTTVQHANVTHSVTARTFSLANIYSLTANKQTLTA